jgi:hypothetical protein
MAEVRAQCEGGPVRYGGIRSLEALYANLAANAIPETIFEATLDHYDEFLVARRALMAAKLRTYYRSL